MDKAEGEILADEPPTPAEAAAPAIPGIRQHGEISTEETPAAASLPAEQQPEQPVLQDRRRPKQ